jgi:hypothetical protein
MSRAGGAPEGVGVFVYAEPQVISGSILLGTDPTAGLRVAQLDGIEQALGLASGSIKSTDLDLVLAEIFKVHADPTGLTALKPLRGHFRERTPLHLGGFGTVYSRPFDSGFLSNAIAVFQVDYRAARLQGVNVVRLQKFTGMTMLTLFGLMANEYAARILPSEYRGDGWLPPATSISDDFEDSATESDWAADKGTFNIDSGGNGYLKATAVEMIVRHLTSLSGDDHFCSCVLDTLSGGNYFGPGTRKASSSTLTFYALLKQGSGTTRWQFFKNITGSWTLLAEWAADGVLGHVAGDDYKLNSSAADSHSGFKNDVEMPSSPTTDTSITSNTDICLVTNDTVVEFASVLAEDPAGAVTFIPRIQVNV